VNKTFIQDAFGTAAKTYEQEAPVQKWTAHLLRQYVESLDLTDVSNILEIGCGTGFLTRELMEVFPEATWTVTDLSADMLETCRQNVAVEATFQQMDGEFPTLEGPFDLIVSSLAMQWFADLPAGLGRLSDLLSPKGHMVFTTLGSKSFQEWRRCLEALSLPVGLHDYPTLQQAQSFDLKGRAIGVSSLIKKQDYQNGLAFLKALKSIGAQSPKSGYRAMNTKELRKVMTYLDKKEECAMTYEILLGHIEGK
jgi:malonyl-CoA O-methyltransferase